MLNTRSRSFFLLSLAIISAGVLAARLWQQSRAAYGLTYRALFPMESIPTSGGQELRMHGHWTLAILFSPISNDSLRKAEYAEVLRAKYAPKGLQVVGFTKDPAKAQIALAEDISIHYPLVSSELLAAEFIGLTDQSFLTYLIDPTAHIQLATQAADAEDMRQIVERYLLHAVDYSPTFSVTRITAGAPLPAGHLQDLRHSQIVELSTLKGRSALFISSKCLTCSVVSILDSYRAWEKQAPQQSWPVLVFSHKFLNREILTKVTDLNIQTEIYKELLTTSTDGAFEDRYRLTPLADQEAAVITISSNNHVENIIGWTQFTQKR